MVIIHDLSKLCRTGVLICIWLAVAPLSLQRQTSGYFIAMPTEDNVFGLANSMGAVLSSILILENIVNTTSKIPVSFQVDGRGYGRIVPGLFNPLSTGTCSGKHVDAISLFLGCCSGIDPLNIPRREQSFLRMHDVFVKYFSIADTIMTDFPADTLGLHYRGTDRMSDGESLFLAPDEFVFLLRDFLAHVPTRDMYVASDTVEFVELAYQQFPNMTLHSFNQRRLALNSSTGLHFSPITDVHVMGHAALTDLVALSRCSVVFKTASTFSAFAKVLNPAVQLLTVTASRFRPPFPEGVLSNNYEGFSPQAKLLLKRTLTTPPNYEAEAVRLRTLSCETHSSPSGCP